MQNINRTRTGCALLHLPGRLQITESPVCRGGVWRHMVGLATLLLVAAWAGPGLAQKPGALGGAAGAVGGPKVPGKPTSIVPLEQIVAALADMPKTLDEALRQAMTRNPEIIMARAKVELAEAEANAARLEVSRKVIALWGERETQAEVRNSLKNIFADLEVRFKTGNILRADYENARVALLQSETRLAQIEAELRYLIGQGAPEGARFGGAASGGSPITAEFNVVMKKPPVPVQLPRSEMVEKVRKALLQPTDMDFNEMPLSEVVGYLRDKHEIQMDVDTTGLDDAGLTADMPITITLKGVPLSAGIQALQDRCPSLMWVVRDYGLLVTTPDRARDMGYFPVLDFARANSQTYLPALTTSVSTPTDSSYRLSKPDVSASGPAPSVAPETKRPTVTPVPVKPKKPAKDADDPFAP